MPGSDYSIARGLVWFPLMPHRRYSVPASLIDLLRHGMHRHGAGSRLLLHQRPFDRLHEFD
jgi:hypothetical protein